MWGGAVESAAIEAQQREAEQVIARQVLNLPADAPLDFNDVGWTSRVYLYAGGQLVAKFPRYAAVKQEYALECAAYTLMQQADISSVSLPEIRAVGEDYAYIAYAGIVGQTLDQWVKTQVLSEVQKKNMGREMGLFLKKLHSLDLTGCPEEDPQQEVRTLQEKYQLGSTYLQIHLSSAELASLEHFVENTSVAELQSFGYERVLCHGDLGFWNMVYRNTLAGPALGVIDFGDIGYYDASRDFVGLSDPIMRDAALAIYGETPHLRSKVMYRQKILPILELPYHLGKGNHAGAVQTLARIRAMLKP